MNSMERLPLGLLLLRLSIFLVMVVWTIDKFLRPEHAAAVYENFYYVGGIGRAVSYLIGAVESFF